jgi:anti-sigma factor RsiW
MSECEWASRLGAYVDGELPEELAGQVRQHLSACANCGAELRRLERLSALWGALDSPAMPARALDRLHASVDQLTWRPVVRLAKAVCGVAAAVLIVCLSGLLWHPIGGPPAGEPRSWEAQAVAPQAADQPDSTEDQLAMWMVNGLSEKGAP